MSDQNALRELLAELDVVCNSLLEVCSRLAAQVGEPQLVPMPRQLEAASGACEIIEEHDACGCERCLSRLFAGKTTRP